VWWLVLHVASPRSIVPCSGSGLSVSLPQGFTLARGFDHEYIIVMGRARDKLSRDLGQNKTRLGGGQDETRQDDVWRSRDLFNLFSLT
jgi:hypothetical protein